MVSLEHYLLTGIPIKTKELGTIHQPTINELISNGFSIEEFDLLFLKADDDNFLFKDSKESSLYRLVNCLKLLYNTNNIKLSYGEQTIYIDNNIEINRNNFTKLADIVLEIFQTSKPVKSNNKPKYKDKYRQQLWEKLERKRAEEAKKNSLTIADIINIVVHTNGYTSYKEVCNMTYYQLLNTYKTMLEIISYNEYLMFKSSGQFEMKQENKHWTSNAKIKKSTIIL